MTTDGVRAALAQIRKAAEEEGDSEKARCLEDALLWNFVRWASLEDPWSRNGVSPDLVPLAREILKARGIQFPGRCA